MAQIIGAVWPMLLTAQGLPTGATRPPRTNPQVTLADSKRVRFRQLMPRPWGWWSFLQCHAWSPASLVPAGPGDLYAKRGGNGLLPCPPEQQEKSWGSLSPQKLSGGQEHWSLSQWTGAAGRPPPRGRGPGPALRFVDGGQPSVNSCHQQPSHKVCLGHCF